MIWGMFMAVTMESAVFMGRIIKTIVIPLRIRQISHSNRCSTYQQNWCLNKMRSQDWKIGWQNHSWKYLSLIGDERIINLQRTKVYVFSDSVLCLGMILHNPESNEAWEQELGWIKSSQSYRNCNRIDGEPTEFEWNIFPGFNTLQLSDKVKSLVYRLGETPENFTGRILFVSMFNDISCGTKDNEKECLANARLVSLYARRFGKGQWSFIGPGSVKKWYSVKEDSPQGIWDIWRKRCFWNLLRADVQFSVQRLHCPGVNSKSKGRKTVDALCSRPRND